MDKIKSVRFKTDIECGPRLTKSVKNDLEFGISVDWDKEYVTILQKRKNRIIVVPMGNVEVVIYEPQSAVAAGPGRGHKKVA